MQINTVVLSDYGLWISEMNDSNKAQDGEIGNAF